MPDEPAAHSRDALVSAWVDFLAPFQWDWFCTLTFREAVHPEAAAKRFRLWISELNRSLFGPRWNKKGKGVYWVCALEYQKRGVIHFHALLSGRGASLNDQARRLYWMDRWFQLAGIARIEPPRSGAVVNYCSKYCAKGGEIELSESMKHFQLYQGERFGTQ